MENLKGTTGLPEADKEISVQASVDIYIDALESLRPPKNVLKVIHQIRLANSQEFNNQVRQLTGGQELDVESIDDLATYFADVADQQALDPEAMNALIVSCERAIWQANTTQSVDHN